MISRRRPFLPDRIETQLPQLLAQPMAGDVVAAFEREVGAVVGAAHGTAVNSGRHGMELIFKHLGIGAGDEVIIPAYTIEDLVPLIQNMGATVVVADIEPDSFNLDPARVVARITARTKAILVLHVFGSPCRLELILEAVRGRSIAVIEDCAHALGSRIGERSAGTFGDAAFYSFETTKTLNTLGGGLVVSADAALVAHVRESMATNRPSLETVHEKLKAMRMERFMFGTGLGWPILFLLAAPPTARLMEALYRRVQHAPPADIQYMPVQAKVGMAALPTLTERLAHRTRMATLYRTLLHPEIQVQAVRADGASTWYFFVVRLPVPAAPVRMRLLLRGIDAGVESEIADDCAALLGVQDCPQVAQVYRHALALPMYDGIDEATVTRVAQVLNRVLR